MPTPPTRLLLVGAGHAHLHLIAHARDLVAAGYEVTVLAPATFDYSGVASATAAGSLPARVGRVDVEALAQRSGAELVEDTLTGLDPEARLATTAGGTEIAYDVLSLNLGSVVTAPGMQIGDDVLRVKPLRDLAELSERLDALPEAAVTVVGAGASGIELAAHLAVRDGVARVTLLDGGEEIGTDLPPGARRRVARVLRTRGVRVRTGTAIREVTSSQVHLGSGLGEGRAEGGGTSVEHDLALLATGLQAPPLIAELGLGDADGVPVTATLQHVDHPEIYAAGDCAHFTPRPLPRIGVHGVRQGPILLTSLLARVDGRALPTYNPQRRALSVLDLGAGVGLAARGRWWLYGAAALRIKRRIDRRWLELYR